MKSILAAIFFAGGVTVNALATVTTRVELINGSVTFTNWSSGSPITVVGGNALRSITVTSDAPDSDSVGLITITGSSQASVPINLAFSQTTRAWTCVNWAGLDRQGNQGVRLTGRVRGDLTGGVDCAAVSFRVDGTVLARVTQRGTGQMTLMAGQIGVVGSVNSLVGVESLDGAEILLETIRRTGETLPDSTGDIHWRVEAPASGGRIASVDCAGNLRADVTANQGSIGNILVGAAFSIRQDPAEQTSNRVNIFARDGIELVRAGRGRVNIVANNASGTGSLQRLTILADSAISASGDLSGDISTHSIPTVAGTPGQPAWTIARSLSANIVTGSGALPGQVVINGGGGSGAWTGAATVGGMVLSGIPEYTLASMAIGSGALGAAPFRLYGNDWMPRNSSTAPGTVMVDNFVGGQAVKMRFYGPVKAANGETTNALPSLLIEREISGTWVEASTGFLASFVTVTGSVKREVRVSDDPAISGASPGLYRVRSIGATQPTNAARLVCESVTGSPNVAGFEYFFRIAQTCYNPDTDFNDDGINSPDDLDDSINCYFEAPPCAQVDFDQNGIVSPDDLADFITAYFTGCA